MRLTNRRLGWLAAGAVAACGTLAVTLVLDLGSPGSGAGPNATAPHAAPNATDPNATATAGFGTAGGGDSTVMTSATPQPSGPASPSAAVPGAPTPTHTSPKPAATGAGLDDPHKKDIAMQLVSSAENSSLNWKAQYRYIEDIGDGRGYTGGIIGFCSGTHDMLELVELYTSRKPGNVLAKYLPALRNVDGSDSHAGLDPNFTKDWATAAQDPAFQQAQNDERDRAYFTPAVRQAKADGLRALGQFIYYDAIVMHGPGNDPVSFGGIRAAALRKAKSPAQGGDEYAYLSAFLDARKAAMLTEAAHDNTDRVDTEQRVFLKARNFTLATPLRWSVYGDEYTISK